MSTGVNNNIKSTRITFETLTITSDMIPEDDGSAIRIKTIELPSGAADLCGNEFANSTIEVQNAPRQQEWLDTVAPNVAASGATEEESYYGDGSEPVLGFRVFAQITDKGYDTSVINSANSDKYISGTNAVGDGDQAQESGVIILNNAAGAASVPYEYSVTTTPDAPTDGWQRAVTGEEAAFTQIDAGVYIHIRLTEEEGGGITEPVLTVMGYDYAGNYTTQEIQVGIQLKDTIAPKTDALMQLSVYDSASVSGNITAFDYSGLSAVKYKIDIIVSESSDFSAPETPSIEEAAADTGLEWIAADLEENSTSVDIFVPETQIEAGKNNCVYVHVYAADIFGNAVVKTYSFNYNLMLPSFTVTVPQGISDGMISISKLNKEEAKNLGWAVEKIQNINFEDSMANDPGDVSYIQSYGSLYVVVRDPVTEEKIGMFVDDLTDANNEFNTYPPSYEPVSKAPFETLDVTDLLSQLRPTEDGNMAVIDALSNTGYFAGGMMWQGWGIDFENSLPAENTPGLIAEFAINDYRYDDMEYDEASKEAVNALAEKFSSYYGDLEIYTMAIDSKWFLQQNHNDEAEQDLSWIRFFQMPDTERRASGKGGNDFKPIMVQKYTVKSARDNGSDKPINTAAITSIRDSSGKIINDDDPRLESSVPAFSGTELDRFRTLSGVQISFRVGNDRVPDWGIEDIDFENSYITVYKDGASFMTQSLNADSADQLFVFPNEEEYGSGTYSVTVTLCAKISGRVDEIELGKTLNVDAAAADADGAFKNITINIEDPAIGELTVKDGITENTPIESVTVPFRASYQYLDYDSETIDTTEGSQAVSKIKMWISGSEDEAVFVNGKRIQLVYQEEEKAYIRNNAVYVPNGQTTTLCYQEVLWNGETSPIRQIAITAGGEGPVSEFEVMPGTISQSAQIKVNSLYSANGDISAIYAFKNGDTSAPINCEVTENGMLSIGGQDTFTESDKWTFMVIDEFGTFSYDANEVLDLGLYIDSAAPELNVTSRNTADGAYSFTLSAADAMSYADAKDLKLYISTKDPNTAADDPEPSESEGTEPETEIDDSTMVFDERKRYDHIYSSLRKRNSAARVHREQYRPRGRRNCSLGIRGNYTDRRSGVNRRQRY